MSVTEAIAFIVAVSGLLTALGTLAVSLSTAVRLGTLHDAVNGQTNLLLRATRAAGFTEGVDAGIKAHDSVGNFPTQAVGNSPSDN